MPEVSLRVLIVEDNPTDARLMQYELERSGFDPEVTLVDDEARFVAALATNPDVVLCDWSLPGFDALRALEIAREQAPDVPFVIVSGSIGEESAVQAMKVGATDYLLKDRLGRLGQAVKQAFAQRDLQNAERRTREELEAREAQYRALADCIPQIVWTARPTGEIEYLNHRALEYTGLELECLVNWKWERVIHPADLQRTLEVWAAVLQTGVPQDVDFRIRRHDGEYRWHIIRQVAVRNGSGGVIRWVGTCTDIHDQKSAAELLTQHAQILAAVRDSVIVTDLNGVVNYWNEGATRLFGWCAAEKYGKPHVDRLPEAVRDKISVAIREGSKGGGWFGEYEEFGKDGTRLWIQARVGPITDAAGRVIGILRLAYDLTERKKAEDKLSAVMRSVNDGIITIDDRGIVSAVNTGVERLFGYPEDELIGQNVRVLMPEPHRGHHDGYLDRYLGTGIAKIIGIGREIEGLRKDGRRFPADLCITECWIEGRRHFTGVVRDITERKKLEEQFRQAQKMEAIGRLAGGIAHDFNNLLTVINGYADMLVPGTPADHPNRAALAAIRDAGERAAALTSQLLAFSRKAIIAPKVLDLNEVILQSEKLLRRLIGEDILLVVVLASTPCRIEADPNQLDQVIMNLAVNARDAMPTGGRLTVETNHTEITSSIPTESGELLPGPYVEFTVRDTGSGMSREIQSRIFEPFFTTKGPGKGTGLGLAAVHGVIKQAGGHITVESAFGVGTAFRILFPAITGPRHEESTVTTPSVQRGTETILLVEDDKAVRTLCQMGLESQGYKVIAAASGREALAAVARADEPIHLMVTDVVMPEMSGRVLAEVVRKEIPGIKVLLVSGHNEDALLRHGVRVAMDAFLQKPFTPFGLARKVRAILDGEA